MLDLEDVVINYKLAAMLVGDVLKMSEFHSLFFVVAHVAFHVPGPLFNFELVYLFIILKHEEHHDAMIATVDIRLR